MKVFSQLISAQAENRSSDYSQGVTGKFWLNTSTSLLKYDSGAVIKTVVSLDDTQTLSNKTLVLPAVDIPLFAQQATPSSPASGKNNIYFKSDNILYTLDSSGNETAVGATAQDSSEFLLNLTLAVTANAGSSHALVVSLKTKAGSDPSSGSPVRVGFRNVTSATGTYLQRSATAALSVTLASGSTLGHKSGRQHYIYVYAIDNAGAIELALSTSFFDEGTVKSTTAEGSGSATSNRPLYSTTARTSVPIRLIGRLSVTEATAGTWDTAPSEICLFPFEKIRPCVQAHAPGASQTVSNSASAVVGFDTIVEDNFNAVSGTGTSWVFTCPMAGIYSFNSFVLFGSNNNHTAGGANITLRIDKNGSTIYNIGLWDSWSTVSAVPAIGGSYSGRFAAGDTVAISVSNTGGLTETFDAGCNIEIIWIGP